MPVATTVPPGSWISPGVSRLASRAASPVCGRLLREVWSAILLVEDRFCMVPGLWAVQTVFLCLSNGEIEWTGVV